MHGRRVRGALEAAYDVGDHRGVEQLAQRREQVQRLVDQRFTAPAAVGDQQLQLHAGGKLLAQGGIYARLWAHQSGGFLGEAQRME